MSGFNEGFSEKFQSATPEEFGSAALTSTEFSSLKGMYNDAKEGLGSEASLGKIKQKVVENIYENGWKQPKDLTASSLAESAISHACVVAEALLEERGEEAAYNTYFSYTTKNQWDRFVYLNLVKLGKVDEGSDLREEWFSLEKRDINNNNPMVNYPKKVQENSNSIYGVSKPLRYLRSVNEKY